jgi:enoyl-CoA hydratase
MLDLKHDSVRVVILTGAGEKAFMAGADIHSWRCRRRPPAASCAGRPATTCENMGKPVIAAINGYALGGGCELAMACTLRLAPHAARSAGNQARADSGYAGTQRLPRLVGRAGRWR